MTNWDYVKDFYKTCFGIDEWVVELYANLDILQLCASGASNNSICKFTDMDLDDVVEIILTTFGFPGWKEDLPVNPYKLYQELENLYGSEFTERQFILTLMKTDLYTFFKEPEVLDYAMLFRICKTMKEIEERIQDEWI